jgi:hypothetical protein
MRVLMFVSLHFVASFHEEDEVMTHKFPHLREDFLTLDELKNLIKKHEASTSRLFMPTMMKLRQVHRDGRMALRKRMVACTSSSNNTEHKVSTDTGGNQEGPDDSDPEEMFLFIPEGIEHISGLLGLQANGIP